MQDRPNYQYYDNNSNKDSSQSMQGSNKGKKSNYKYYKGGSNKNNLNNMDEKMNVNDHSQNYQHYRNRGNRKNYQDMNSNQNPNFKKKNKKKRENNNDYQYQGNNATEINQSTKEEYLDKQNNINIGGGNNNHQNIYGKQYKKNQNQNYNNNLINNNINSNLNNTIGSINTNNSNSTNSSNISTINLTPQGKNQITTPLGYNMNNSNSPLNRLITQPQQNIQNQAIYINPKLVIMGNMRNTSVSENEQDLGLKDEKSSENLSEEALSIGRNLQQSQNDINNNNIDKNKIQNEFMNPEMIMNNKFLQQQGGYFPMHYKLNNNMNNNFNNINNSIDNINNMKNVNTNIQNMQNYNQNIANQINNSIQNMNNLGLNNFQRQIYDNQNNKIFNKAIQQNYSFTNNDEIKNHKQIKKFQNQSPTEPNNLTNPSINLGNMINLNYNGQNNNFIKNQNNNMNNQINLSAQGTKNTIPNFTQNDNLNLISSQSQQMPSLINMNFNRNFYIPQNMRNSHMNNNFINNNHMNGLNNGFNHNNLNNNKKYQKQFNYNNNYQLNNHLNNNNNQNYNKNNKNNLTNDINNKNINNNLSKNYNQRTRKESFGFTDSNKSNNIHMNNNNIQPKHYLLCLNLKLGKNKETIKIKSLEDCPIVLKELKENKNINEKALKLIQNKIYEAIEITKKIFNFGLDKYTCKNLAEINNKLIYNKVRKNNIIFKKNNSSKQINKYFEDEIKLTNNDIKKNESLNITF